MEEANTEFLATAYGDGNVQIHLVSEHCTYRVRIQSEEGSLHVTFSTNPKDLRRFFAEALKAIGAP